MDELTNCLNNLEIALDNIIKIVPKIKFIDERSGSESVLFNLKEAIDIIPRARANLKLIHRLVNSELYLCFMLIKNLFFYLPKEKTEDITTFFNNYISFVTNYQQLKSLIKKSEIADYQQINEIIVDPNSPLWDIQNMHYLKIPSDLSILRRVTDDLTIHVTDISSTEKDILSQQISELIKNAMKHGNKLNPEKSVNIWYHATPKFYKLIVEDEGEGFKNLEDWNEFNRKRNKAIQEQDFEMMFQYMAYRTPKSDETDGGNALFAAVEYWDSGLIFNEKRNKVVAIKYFY